MNTGTLEIPGGLILPPRQHPSQDGLRLTGEPPVPSLADAQTAASMAYDSKIEGNVIFTRLDASINWMRELRSLSSSSSP